jgi:hypothetical protein
MEANVSDSLLLSAPVQTMGICFKCLWASFSFSIEFADRKVEIFQTMRTFDCVETNVNNFAFPTSNLSSE